MVPFIILLSILLLSSPVIGQETGVLYQYETSFGIQWKTFGDGKVQPKYKGEIKNGEMDGFGVLTYPYDGKSIIGEWKDGKEWNTKHRKKDGTLIGKYENGKWIVSLFVNVGGYGTFVTSSDGLSWTKRTSGISDHLYGVTYGNGLFVTVGLGIILTSPDGISWTIRTSGTYNNFYGVTYGNGIFVTVGYRGIILTSSDGITWTERTSGTSKSLSGVTYFQ